jgi:hypothetical protein
MKVVFIPLAVSFGRLFFPYKKSFNPLRLRHILTTYRRVTFDIRRTTHMTLFQENHEEIGEWYEDITVFSFPHLKFIW